MSKKRLFSFFKLVVVLGFAITLQACSLTVPIDSPDVSEYAYTQKSDGAVANLKFENKLDENHKLSSSKLPIHFKHNGEAVDPAPFVFESLEKELASRMLPVQYLDSSENVVQLEKFNILSHRVSGFSPMVTISTMQADLKTSTGTKTIASMVKRAKLPVWTMTEVNEPCYNEPVELMIKELAAKINNELFGYSLDDAIVDSLVEKIKRDGNDDKLAYFDVYELGFSNNPKAIAPLKEFTTHNSDYIRLSAISGLGILGATEHFDYLKSIYRDAKIWQDRGMALKAIGDLGTTEGIAFLSKEKEKWAEQTSNEAVWNTIIINLYLD